jgi:catechol 2,3-dioxygenase-like lactoylglutathione lyase family enzyme
MSHIHLWVSDIERSVQFYTQAFGMTHRFPARPGLASLTTPGTNDSISLNYDQSDVRPKGEMGTIAHFGFRLADPADLDSAIAEVIAAGGSLVSSSDAQSNGRRTAYVADPDGYLIEL